MAERVNLVHLRQAALLIQQVPTDDDRSCGECDWCCRIGEIRGTVRGAPFFKPYHQDCPHRAPAPEGNCAVYADRPECCASFLCSWRRGLGFAPDRPDLSGLMLTVNECNGGPWIFAMETRLGAHRESRGAALIMNAATQVDLPVIVVRADAEPGSDFGDYVVLKESLRPRAKRMMGRELAPLDPGGKFAVYELLVEE